MPLLCGLKLAQKRVPVWEVWGETGGHNKQSSRKGQGRWNVLKARLPRHEYRPDAYFLLFHRRVFGNKAGFHRIIHSNKVFIELCAVCCHVSGDQAVVMALR